MKLTSRLLRTAWPSGSAILNSSIAERSATFLQNRPDLLVAEAGPPGEGDQMRGEQRLRGHVPTVDLLEVVRNRGARPGT